jgi:hypothetical protein
MMHQPLVSEKVVNSNLYYFRDYKKKKPFFKSPMKISIDAPYSETYYLVNNIVYNDKQILALKKEQDSLTIFLVEAQIEDGQLASISKLSEQYVEEIANLLKDII